MIKNRRVQLALAMVNRVAPFLGQDFVSDFTDVADEPVAFESAFNLPPVGVAFSSDFVTGSYQMAGGPEVYGRFLVPASAFGSHAVGLADIVLYDGFESDFVLWASPQEPVGFEGIAFYADFVTGRYVAETYPPPIAFDSDFAATPAQWAFTSDFVAGVYRIHSGPDIWGVFTLNTDTFVFSGTPLRVPAPFVLEQSVPGNRSLDDRLGQFVLGHTILGGPSL